MSHDNSNMLNYLHESFRENKSQLLNLFKAAIVLKIKHYRHVIYPSDFISNVYFCMQQHDLL